MISVKNRATTNATSFPGSSLYLEKVPWLRLVTCLLDFSRFEGEAGKVKVCLHKAHLLNPVGSGICNLGKTHSKGIDTFDIGVQFSAKKLALHLAEVFPSIFGRYLKFVVVKRFGKELGNDATAAGLVC